MVFPKKSQTIVYNYYDFDEALSRHVALGVCTAIVMYPEPLGDTSLQGLNKEGKMKMAELFSLKVYPLTVKKRSKRKCNFFIKSAF